MLHVQQHMGRHCLTMCDGGIVCRSVRLCRFSICIGGFLMPLVSCLGGLSTRFIHPCDSDFVLAALSCRLCLVLADCHPLCAVIHLCGGWSTRLVQSFIRLPLSHIVIHDMCMAQALRLHGCHSPCRGCHGRSVTAQWPMKSARCIL